MRDEVLHVDPRLPHELERLCMSLRYRQHRLGLEVTHEDVTIAFEDGRPAPAWISVRGELVEMAAGERRRFSLHQPHEQPDQPNRPNHPNQQGETG
jgi:trehalose/maltose hydrolase-like predicted phosphorylase